MPEPSCKPADLSLGRSDSLKREERGQLQSRSRRPILNTYPLSSTPSVLARVKVGDSNESDVGVQDGMNSVEERVEGGNLRARIDRSDRCQGAEEMSTTDHRERVRQGGKRDRSSRVQPFRPLGKHELPAETSPIGQQESQPEETAAMGQKDTRSVLSKAVDVRPALGGEPLSSNLQQRLAEVDPGRADEGLVSY